MNTLSVMTSPVLGVDIGSVAVKAALVSATGITHPVYRRIDGSALDVFRSLLASYRETLGNAMPGRLALTGRGVESLAAAGGWPVVNEIFAQGTGALVLEPAARSVIDIGGNDAAWLALSENARVDAFSLASFATNSRCAAGTGSFLDQQAARLGLSIEDEFSRMALSAENIPHIAGRCSVFAKSDMIHLQQIATPDREIVAGLCQAMAESFRSDIMKGRIPDLPVAFQGGVSRNQAMAHFLRKVFQLEEEQLLVNELGHLAGAIGAAVRGHCDGKCIPLADALALASIPVIEEGGLLPLKDPLEAYPAQEEKFVFPEDGATVDVFLGIDIGSVSTNLVLLDSVGRLVTKRYLPTAGRPIDAVLEGLKDIQEECGARVRVLGCGTTGSGRYLIADLFGADIVKNEITAQARGALHLCPDTDTIFEIGGQDSKYVAIDNGVVTDFTMNKACAAGTGSFIEEQANLMGIPIRRVFAERAFASSRPAPLGQRCTVFIESDVVRRMAEGDSIENLSAGIAYSVVKNYLHRVVENRRIGTRVLFQGGTASNHAVTAAFRSVTGVDVRVPPHNDVTGAIGMAAIVREAWMEARFTSGFIGLACGDLDYSIRTFVCNACANKCQIREVRREGGVPFFYGHRCERYEHSRTRAPDADQLDFFKERTRILERYTNASPPAESRGKIGIPMALSLYETLPFWSAFWNAMGYDIVTSGPTTRAIATVGIDRSTAETCFPVKVFHGHASSLLDAGVDYLFVPSVINMALDGSSSEHNFNCTLVQSAPFLLRSAFRGREIPLLDPVVHMQYGYRRVIRELEPLAKSLGIPRQRLARALARAWEAQRLWREELAREALAFVERHRDRPLAVIVSRPYNGCDPGLNLDIPRRLAENGIPALPLESLPLTHVASGGADALSRQDGDELWGNMYWRYGQRIMRGLEWIAGRPGTLPVYITNFSCGPDSFLLHYAQEIMAGRPLLVLELDEHSADAGIVTRLEAFLDSAVPRAWNEVSRITPVQVKTQKTLRGKKVWVPNMSDVAIPIAAAFRRAGIEAEVLPEPDSRNIELGRKITSGKECYPLVLTAGDIFRIAEMPGHVPGKSVFFMPTTNGPCRFGEYARLQSLLLQRQELEGIEIFSPNSGTGYGELRELSMGFYLDIWKGMVCTDTLQKALHATRPYETNPGQSDAVYAACLVELEKALESKKRDLAGLMKDFRARFAAIPGREPDGVLVGMVGEIYVRTNRFANGDVIRRLEQLGAEVVFAPFTEWSFYVNQLSMQNNLDQKQYLGAAGDWLRNRIQYSIESRLAAPFHQDNLFEEPEIRDVLEAAGSFIDQRIRGEAVLTVGKAVDFIHRGFAGIVNVMPFSCMPGLIVSALAPAIRERYHDIPWLNLVFEDSASDIDQMRLEAFVEQARAWQEQFGRRKHAR